MNTLRGIPVEYDWAWVVVIRRWDGAVWFPALFSIARTRAEAIRRFDSVDGGDPYPKMRRKGKARALRCRIQPTTFGEA